MKYYHLLLAILILNGCGEQPSNLERFYGSAGQSLCEGTGELWNKAFQVHLTAKDEDRTALYTSALQTVLRNRYQILLKLYPNDSNSIQLKMEETDRKLFSGSGMKDCDDLMIVEDFFMGEMAAQYASNIQAAAVWMIDPYPSIFHEFLDAFARKLDYFSQMSTANAQLQKRYSFGFSLKITTEPLIKNPIKSLTIFAVDKDHILSAGERITKITKPSDESRTSSDLLSIEDIAKTPNGLSKISNWIENPEHRYLGLEVESLDGVSRFVSLAAREDWKTPSINLFIRDRAIIIEVKEFSEGVSEELKTKLELATKNLWSAPTSVVLDLRWNPGGRLDEFLKMSGFFLGDREIYRMRTRQGISSIRSVGSILKPLENLPVMVLINQSSASAAELLAYALQSTHRAVVAGERSFGKAIAQTGAENPRIFGSLYLTYGMLFDSEGKTYQMKGVIPDIEIKDKTIQKCIPNCKVERMENLPSNLTIRPMENTPSFTSFQNNPNWQLKVEEKWKTEDINGLLSEPAIYGDNDPALQASLTILKKLP